MLKIDLDRIETNVPIRNDRVKELLFETGKFPTADISLNLDKQRIQQLNAGKPVIWRVKAALNLHGITKTVEAEVNAVLLKSGDLMVNTVQLIIVPVADFNLTDGLAKLKSIATSVPVTFNLRFQKQ